VGVSIDDRRLSKGEQGWFIHVRHAFPSFCKELWPDQESRQGFADRTSGGIGV
jgi:hypothetical protein